MNSVIHNWYVDFCKRKSDINEHLPILHEYGKKSESIVELGVRKGQSTVALLNARSPKLTSFDIVLTSQAKVIEAQAKIEGIPFELAQGIV